MKKILVTGANGQLGNEMRLLAEEHKNFEYFFTDVAELDICDEQAVMDFVSAHQIDVIVNCAAYTAVDKAEDNVELCDKLNADKDQLNELLHQLTDNHRIITQNGMLQIRK